MKGDLHIDLTGTYIHADDSGTRFEALNPDNTIYPVGNKYRVSGPEYCAPLDEPPTPVKTDLEKLLEMATNVAVNNAYALRDREALERLIKVFAETVAPLAKRKGRKVRE